MVASGWDTGYRSAPEIQDGAEPHVDDYSSEFAHSFGDASTPMEGGAGTAPVDARSEIEAVELVDENEGIAAVGIGVVDAA